VPHLIPANTNQLNPTEMTTIFSSRRSHACFEATTAHINKQFRFFKTCAQVKNRYEVGQSDKLVSLLIVHAGLEEAAKPRPIQIFLNGMGCHVPKSCPLCKLRRKLDFAVLQFVKLRFLYFQTEYILMTAKSFSTSFTVLGTLIWNYYGVITAKITKWTLCIICLRI
jgi:hypothetical protein